jgi:uncharacterized oxidoreductase
LEAGSIDQAVVIERAVAARWGEELLVALGARADPAGQTIEHLLEAEDAGHPSHGLRMLVSMATAIRQGRLVPAAEAVVEAAIGSVCRIDGRRGLGPPIGQLATAEAVRLAREHGTGAVAVRSAGHMGRLAPFAQAAAAAGCVLLMCVTDGGANQHVVPPGARSGRLSTNPLAFGVPRATPPHLVVDLATSAYAHGTLAALREAGRPPPDGALLPGSQAGGEDLLLPMAAHKGFALGLIVEALAGALTGAGVVSPDPGPESQGALLLALDVAAISSLAAVTRDVDAAIDWVRSVAGDGAEPLRIPGEFRVATPEKVEIAGPVWSALTELSNTHQVGRPEPEARGASR